jgi:hypothetical protein
MMLERRNGKMSVCVCHAVVVMNERFRDRVNRCRLHHTGHGCEAKNIRRKATTSILGRSVGICFKRVYQRRVQRVYMSFYKDRAGLIRYKEGCIQQLMQAHI